MEECRSPEKAWWVLLKAKVSQKTALHCFTASTLVQAAVIPKVRVWTHGLNITHLGHLSTVKSQHRVHLRVQRKAASSWRRRIRRLAVLIISNTGGQRGHGSCLNIKVWDSGRTYITWNLCFQPCTHSLLPKVGADGCTQLFSSLVPLQLETVREGNLKLTLYVLLHSKMLRQISIPSFTEATFAARMHSIHTLLCLWLCLCLPRPPGELLPGQIPMQILQGKLET